MNKRQGFTVIELIVAISIIMVLIGMLVVGIQYVGASSREKSTRVTMENLQSMLSELENTAGLGRLRFDDYNSDDVLDFPGVTVAPGSVTEGSADRTGQAVQLTRDALTVMLAIPANQSAISQLPTEQLWTFPEGTRNQNTPVLLDAWHNPIILVFPPDTAGVHPLEERYGLVGVTVDGLDGEWRVVNPGGLDPMNGGKKYPQTPAEAVQKMPHFRPFWVSAGPDGDFRTHDDNIYSFEN